MRETSLDAIMESFDPTENQSTLRVKSGGCVSIWLPDPYKAYWDKLQSKTDRRFGKKARELLMASIQKAMTKAT
jgi:hypothetical protein